MTVDINFIQKIRRIRYIYGCIGKRKIKVLLNQSCKENGGELIIGDEVDGQSGYCIFDDVSRCEEWAFYKGECNVGENM